MMSSELLDPLEEAVKAGEVPCPLPLPTLPTAMETERLKVAARILVSGALRPAQTRSRAPLTP